MNIKQLNTLRAVRAHGSVNAAAAELFLSPSAVSQQLQSLASACGFAIVERHGRGIRFTDRGLEVTELADEIIDRWESALTSIRQRAEGGAASPGRTVRLGALPSVYESWLIPAVRNARAATGVSMELFETRPHEAHELIAAERLDLAVVARCPNLDPGSLATLPLCRGPFVLVAPPHLAGSISDPSLRAFADVDWVLPQRETCGHEVVLEHCARLGFRPRAVGRSNDWQVAQEMAALLTAVTLIPSSHRTETDGLTAVGLPPPELPTWQVELITRAPVTVAPWFSALHQEMSRLSRPAVTGDDHTSHQTDAMRGRTEWKRQTRWRTPSTTMDPSIYSSV